MAWYFSHAIFYIKLEDGDQDEFPVWELIFLIDADNDEEALHKAGEVARAYEKDTRNVFYCGHPALQIFKGIRKIICWGDRSFDTKMMHGEELTYSQFEVESEADVERLAKGKPVKILHIE